MLKLIDKWILLKLVLIHSDKNRFDHQQLFCLKLFVHHHYQFFLLLNKLEQLIFQIQHFYFQCINHQLYIRQKLVDILEVTENKK